MDKEPSTSRGIKHSIPQELKDGVDEIASKRPNVTGNEHYSKTTPPQNLVNIMHNLSGS